MGRKGRLEKEDRMSGFFNRSFVFVKKLFFVVIILRFYKKSCVFCIKNSSFFLFFVENVSGIGYNRIEKKEYREDNEIADFKKQEG